MIGSIFIFLLIIGILFGISCLNTLLLHKIFREEWEKESEGIPSMDDFFTWTEKTPTHKVIFLISTYPIFNIIALAFLLLLILNNKKPC